MIYDLQKADIWKRGSAALFDFIFLVIGSVGCVFLLSLVVGFQGYSDSYQARQEVFETKYEVSFDEINDLEAYNKLSDEERATLDAAFKEFAQDDEANYLFNMLFQLTIITITFGILISYLLLEFVVPMLFKNGQTLGKKIFGLAVMRVDHVKISGPILFIRSILGKYTIETMVPIMLLLLVAFGALGGLGIIVAALIPITGIIMMIITKTNSPIHDLLANTVTVDLASQMIFDSPEALLEYKEKIHREAVEKASY